MLHTTAGQCHGECYCTESPGSVAHHCRPAHRAVPAAQPLPVWLCSTPMSLRAAAQERGRQARGWHGAGSSRLLNPRWMRGRFQPMLRGLQPRFHLGMCWELMIKKKRSICLCVPPIASPVDAQDMLLKAYEYLLCHRRGKSLTEVI